MTIDKIRVLQFPGKMNCGGAEAMIMNIFRKIDRERVQFDFISLTSQECWYDNEIVNLGGEIYYLNSIEQIGLVNYIIQLKNFIKKNNYHIVHTHVHLHSGIVLLAAWLAGVKVRIAHAHTTKKAVNYKEVIKNGILKSLISFVATDFLACSTEAGINLFGRNNGRMKLIANGIDLQKFNYIEKKELNKLRKDLDINENTLVIGHIGTFKYAKNHDYILEIIQTLKEKKINFKFILVGDGTEKERIMDNVNALELNHEVLFLGNRSDIPQLMKIFDVFVLPSIYEGFPMVLVEAQAAGTPCVISDTITQEVDLGLNLIDFCSIKDSPSTWANTITSIQGKTKVNHEVIGEVFQEKGYNIERVIDTLMNCYERVSIDMYN